MVDDSVTLADFRSAIIRQFVTSEVSLLSLAQRWPSKRLETLELRDFKLFDIDLVNRILACRNGPNLGHFRRINPFFIIQRSVIIIHSFSSEDFSLRNSRRGEPLFRARTALVRRTLRLNFPNGY